MLNKTIVARMSNKSISSLKPKHSLNLIPVSNIIVLLHNLYTLEILRKQNILVNY